MLHQRKAVAPKSDTIPQAVLSTDRWSASNPADLPEGEWLRWFDSPEGTAHREACWAVVARRSHR